MLCIQVINAAQIIKKTFTISDGINKQVQGPGYLGCSQEVAPLKPAVTHYLGHT